LSEEHPFRYDTVGFDGNVEHVCAPEPLSGSVVLAKLEGTTFTYGKGETQLMDADEKDDQQIWKKRSMFFDLPYWEFNTLRHNLDVMHIEKNVCDDLLGTLLNLKGKSKDNLKARKHLHVMKIRSELHPILLPNGKYELPSTPYTLSSDVMVSGEGT